MEFHEIQKVRGSIVLADHHPFPVRRRQELRSLQAADFSALFQATGGQRKRMAGLKAR
jgi:hypothetical protein